MARVPRREPPAARHSEGRTLCACDAFQSSASLYTVVVLLLPHVFRAGIGRTRPGRWGLLCRNTVSGLGVASGRCSPLGGWGMEADCKAFESSQAGTNPC